MNFTNKIYDSIMQDIYNQKEPFAGVASRMVSMNNDIKMVYAINIGTYLREAYVSLKEKPDQISFPKWHGTSIDVVRLSAYGEDGYFVRLLQLPHSEDYIFDIVVDDLRNAIGKLKSIEQCMSCVSSILLKWKKFFQAEKDLVLSDEMQEGLYGELYFLEQSIKRRSAYDVYNWAGGNGETHDFYYLAHAVEIKTSSMREPYTATISSEYQLDSNDIPGKLFLYFIALRKSKSSGERLPDIISRIRHALSSDASLAYKFNEKLKMYGYFDEAEDQYITGFSVRDGYYFEVIENFPRIIRSMYMAGISTVVYKLSISQCMPYECSEDEVFHVLERGMSGDQ